MYGFDLYKDPEDIRDFQLSTPPRLELPRKVDWRPNMSPVKDQGQLGSCVGFATVAMKEFQEQQEHVHEVEDGKVDHREGKPHYDLSEAWIYWMCKKIDEWPGQEGTSIRSAMKVLHKIGVPVEEAWPYDARLRGEPKVWSPLIARWGKIESYRRVQGVDGLRAALVQGPVVIGIACFEEIFSPLKDGYISMPKSPQYCYGGHAICVVAYNDTSERFTFKNSWSPYWGDSGYGQLSYGYIRAHMWDAWQCKDLSVTKEMMKGAVEILER